MFCTACGTAITAGQPVCSKCGQPLTPMAPAGPAVSFELDRYRSHVRALAIVWFIYGALSLLLGIVGLAFARNFVLPHLGQWINGPDAPPIPPGFFQMMLHFAWIAVAIRAALAFFTGWGLMQEERWGRILAIIASVLALIRIPLGTALGIWTLVMLLGYRHSQLYEQL